MHLMLHIGFYELYRKRHFSEMVASEIILLALFDGIVSTSILHRKPSGSRNSLYLILHAVFLQRFLQNETNICILYKFWIGCFIIMFKERKMCWFTLPCSHILHTYLLSIYIFYIQVMYTLRAHQTTKEAVRCMRNSKNIK